MQTKFLYAKRHQSAEALRQLLARKTVLGIAGIAHDGISQHKFPAGIIPAAHRLRDAAVFLEKFNMRNIIQIDQHAHFGGKLKFLRRRIVGGKHNIMPRNAASVGEHELCKACAIHAAALLCQKLHDHGVGQCLYRKVFPKSCVP